MTPDAARPTLSPAQLDVCKAVRIVEENAFPQPLPVAEACALLTPLLQLQFSELARRVIETTPFDIAELNLLAARLAQNQGRWKEAAQALSRVPKTYVARIPDVAFLDRNASLTLLLSECQELLDFAPPEEIAGAADFLWRDDPTNTAARRLAIQANIRAGLTAAGWAATQDLPGEEPTDAASRQLLLLLCLEESRKAGLNDLIEQAATAAVALLEEDRELGVPLLLNASENRDPVLLGHLAKSRFYNAHKQAILTVRAMALKGDTLGLFSVLKQIQPEGGAGFFHRKRLVRFLYDEACTAFEQGNRDYALQMAQGLLQDAPDNLRFRLLVVAILARQGKIEAIAGSVKELEALPEVALTDSAEAAPDQDPPPIRLLRRSFREAMVGQQWATAEWAADQLASAGANVSKEAWKLLHTLLRDDLRDRLPTHPRLKSLDPCQRALILLKWSILTEGQTEKAVEACIEIARWIDEQGDIAESGGSSLLEETLQLLVPDHGSSCSGLFDALSHHPDAANGTLQRLTIIGLALQENLPPLFQYAREIRADDPSEVTLVLKLVFKGALDRSKLALADQVYRLMEELHVLSLEETVRLRLHRQEPVEAEMLLERSELTPQLRDNLRLMTATEGGEPVTALARSLPSLRHDPLNPNAFLVIGNAMVSLGFDHEAAALLKPTKNSTKNECCLWARAVTSSDPSQGIEAWQQVRTLHPGSVRANISLARLLADELQYEEALQLLESCLINNPDSIPALRARAHYYQNIGHWNRWRQETEENVTRFPHHPTLLSDLARCLVELGHPAQAEAILAQIDVVGEDRLAVKRAMARRYLIERRLGEALALMKAISGTPQAGHADEYFYAVLLFANSQFNEALAHLKVHSNRFPGIAHLASKIAQAIERLDLPKEALSAWRRAHFHEPSSSASLTGIARCLAYLGKREEFRSWMTFFPSTGLGPIQSGLHRAWEYSRHGESSPALISFQEARNRLRKYTRILESTFDRDPSLVHFRGTWRKHPNPLYTESNHRFWNLIRRMRTGRVVVVGNSPCILNTGLGAQIDTHDVVIRLNDFRTEGFEGDVGSKTSVWYSSAVRFAQLKARQLAGFEVLLRPPTFQHYPEIESFCRARLGLTELGTPPPFYLPTPFYKLIDDLLYPRLTTGLQMIVLLLSVLDQPIHLAGFDFFIENTNHYFEGKGQRLPVGEAHALRFENEFVLRLLQEVGAVKLLSSASSSGVK